MITHADIRIIANSFTRDMTIRYVYCSPCNSTTASIKLIISRVRFQPRFRDKSSFPSSFPQFAFSSFVSSRSYRSTSYHTGNREGIEACAIATKHCRDGDDDVPGMSGFGEGNRRGWVSMVVSDRKWGKLTKITRK